MFGGIIQTPVSSKAIEIGEYGFLTVPRGDVTFRLWNRNNPVTFRPLFTGHLEDEGSLRNDKQYKIIIHGWTDSASAEWYKAIVEEYLKKDDIEVIGIDWKKPASALYPFSVKYTRDVGKYVGELLVDLHNTLGVPFENMHIIGHSLGAHISGFAAKYIKSQKQGKVARITGMDPAGPLFLLAGANDRLSSGDANFVDVIHTDGGKFGLSKVIGHVDFYPNGGSAPQPGCVLFNGPEREDIVDVGK